MIALLAALALVDQDPVRLTVTTPAPATVAVAVDTDPGALDPRAGAIHIHVKLARGVCGGSYAGTSGVTAIDVAPQPQPTPGAAYHASAQGTPALDPGTYSVCVYLDDDEGRQWATDTDSELVVSPPSSGGGGGGTRGTPGSACAPRTRAPTAKKRRIARGGLIASARVARRHGHATLLLRARMSARVTVHVGRRTFHRRARPCRLAVVRLPGRHGRAKVAVTIRRGSERRTVRF